MQLRVNERPCDIPGTILTAKCVFGNRRDLVIGGSRLKSGGPVQRAAWFILRLTVKKKLLWLRGHTANMSGDEETQEQTVADDLVVTKYKMGAEIANRKWNEIIDSTARK